MYWVAYSGLLGTSGAFLSTDPYYVYFVLLYCARPLRKKLLGWKNALALFVCVFCLLWIPTGRLQAFVGLLIVGF